MKRIKTIATRNLCESAKKGGCGECQTSCQSGCCGKMRGGSRRDCCGSLFVHLRKNGGTKRGSSVSA